MNQVAFAALAGALALGLYTYLGYPAMLWILSRLRPPRPAPPPPETWPTVTITIPAYNEEASIASTLERVLDLDYPADRRHVLVVSDASTDRTDEIVAGFADRGVELLRMPRRSGKTAAENAARERLRGEIIVNSDATIHIGRDALKPLIAAFADPSVGVASGRDISVAKVHEAANSGESGYVNYEMWVRGLETRLDGIVGASGCYYASRKQLHMSLVPEALSRDFASALIARELGYRAVSVDQAVCLVPRTGSLRREYRRKVRTFTRGMETLYHKRHLLNPLRHGLFAWMLFSHKLCRWLVPWAGLVAVLAFAVLAQDHWWARWALGAVAAVMLLAWLGWSFPEDSQIPRILSMPAFAAAGNLAAIVAAVKATRGELNPIWEPTRRM